MRMDGFGDRLSGISANTLIRKETASVNAQSIGNSDFERSRESNSTSDRTRISDLRQFCSVWSISRVFDHSKYQKCSIRVSKVSPKLFRVFWDPSFPLRRPKAPNWSGCWLSSPHSTVSWNVVKLFRHS